MTDEIPPATGPRWAALLVIAATLLGAGLCLVLLDEPKSARSAALAVLCLGLWLGEIVPAFVPTLVLLVGSAVLVPGGSLERSLGWMGDPVLALFFGGFVLGEAISVHGIDRAIARWTFGLGGGRARPLVGVILAVTAFLSMWMSNIAAAALMMAALKPTVRDADAGIGRSLLVAVALGANLGGMATPIGTGPNAIALSAMADPPSFVQWMVFAIPLTIGSLLLAYAMLAVRVSGTVVSPAVARGRDGEQPGRVWAITALTVALWLAEPLHGVSAPVVALAAATVLFGTGLVPAGHLGKIDWSTLILVAGGMALGRLLEDTGLLDRLAGGLASSTVAPGWLLLGLLTATAAMSAVMSNTATAAMMIPVASVLVPGQPAIPILVAMAASYGMPFVTSTPPNAMAIGAGARASELLVPGLVLMIVGCLVLVLTGPAVLGWFLSAG